MAGYEESSHFAANSSRAVSARGSIDRFTISRHGLAVFPRDIAQRVANQMDNAYLDLGLRIDGGDGLRKSFEAITARHQHILKPPILKVCEHSKPELSAFSFGFPNP